MTLGASIAVLAVVIAVIAVILSVHFNRRPRNRKRRTNEALDSLSDPPTITHYGHG